MKKRFTGEQIIFDTEAALMMYSPPDGIDVPRWAVTSSKPNYRTYIYLGSNPILTRNGRLKRRQRRNVQHT